MRDKEPCGLRASAGAGPERWLELTKKPIVKKGGARLPLDKIKRVLGELAHGRRAGESWKNITSDLVGRLAPEIMAEGSVRGVLHVYRYRPDHMLAILRGEMSVGDAYDRVVKARALGLNYSVRERVASMIRMENCLTDMMRFIVEEPAPFEAAWGNPPQAGALSWLNACSEHQYNIEPSQIRGFARSLLEGPASAAEALIRPGVEFDWRKSEGGNDWNDPESVAAARVAFTEDGDGAAQFQNLYQWMWESATTRIEEMEEREVKNLKPGDAVMTMRPREEEETVIPEPPDEMVRRVTQKTVPKADLKKVLDQIDALEEESFLEKSVDKVITMLGGLRDALREFEFALRRETGKKKESPLSEEEARTLARILRKLEGKK